MTTLTTSTLEATIDTTAPASPFRVPLTIVLALLAPPLALAAWILLSGGARPRYLRSPLIRSGMIVLLVAALPLLVVFVADTLGVWPDPNPNPVGFGLLFLAGGAVACVLVLAGILVTSLRPTSERP